MAENIKLFYLKLQIPMIYNFVQIMFVRSSSHTPYMSSSSKTWLPSPWVHIICACDWLNFYTWFMKKSLKIPKEQSESVNRRRTDNPCTMVIRKRTKGQTTIYKTKDRATRSPLKSGSEIRCSGMLAVPAPLVAPVVLI
jgi:hypothetical protein